VNSAPAPDHYSYRHYADPATARAFDTLRFGGPVGALVADAQARVLLDVLDQLRKAGHAGDRAHPHPPPMTERIRPTRPSIVDVGTGTGRAALLLARGGARVTGVDASEAMLAVAQQRAAVEGADVTFQVGDAHALPFSDRSFDAAVTLRVLMHTPDWRRCVAELCRVADRFVIADYPSALSVASLESLARRTSHAFGARTEPYRVFRPATIAEAFAGNGFQVRATHRQFVLPIALHKAIGSVRFTQGIEAVLQRIGLLRVFGSPVTIVAERCGSS
jgi:2-polyprenyl-3-methyl-5-hydroxy-6-metoxy-1,4-benzoquinol methylase